MKKKRTHRKSAKHSRRTSISHVHRRKQKLPKRRNRSKQPKLPSFDPTISAGSQNDFNKNKLFQQKLLERGVKESPFKSSLPEILAGIEPIRKIGVSQWSPTLPNHKLKLKLQTTGNPKRSKNINSINNNQTTISDKILKQFQYNDTDIERMQEIWHQVNKKDSLSPIKIQPIVKKKVVQQQQHKKEMVERKKSFHPDHQQNQQKLKSILSRKKFARNLKIYQSLTFSQLYQDDINRQKDLTTKIEIEKLLKRFQSAKQFIDINEVKIYQKQEEQKTVKNLFMTNTGEEGEEGTVQKQQRIHNFKRGIWNLLEMEKNDYRFFKIKVLNKRSPIKLSFLFTIVSFCQ